MFRFRRVKSPEQLPLPKNPDTWQDIRFVLGRVGMAWLDKAPSAQAFDAAFAGGTLRAESPYVALGDFLYSDFHGFANNYSKAEAIDIDSQRPNYVFLGRTAALETVRHDYEGIRRGFQVMGRVLSFAVPAHNELHGGSLQTLNDIDGLAHILHRGKSFGNTVDLIAKQHKNKQGFSAAVAWENRLGLGNEAPSHTAPGTPFVIKHDPDGQGYLDINPLWTTGLESVPGRGCPARGAFMMGVWHHAIEIAVESDHLFRTALPQQ